MQRGSSESLVYYRFEHMPPDRGLVQAMFTRLGGRSRQPWATLNTGSTVGDDPAAVDANQRLICGALGIQPADLVSPHQVHSATVEVVDERDRGRTIPQTDALITATPGVMLMLRFADCVPVALFDPRRRVTALAHAGWRGTAAGVARATVERMHAAFGCRPEDVLAGIGPAIGPCCYEVGSDVAKAVRQAFPGAVGLLEPRDDLHWHLDLWSANERQLLDAGVRDISVAGICTACHTDEWFSHRAEGGRTGRWGAVIGLRDVVR